MSDVAHYEGLAYWSPVHPDRVEALLGAMEPAPAGRALDLGCGRAEALIRLAERFGLEGRGVDLSPAAIEEARRAARRRSVSDRLRFEVADAETLTVEAGSLAALVWLGGPRVVQSSGEAPTAEATVARLAEWLAPGGWLLMGHAFWAADPPPAYLAEVGLTRADLPERGALAAAARDAGLVAVRAHESPRQAWEVFESMILSHFEVRLAADPEDAALKAEVARRRAFDEAQRRWGRDAMGFELALYRRSLSPAARPG